LLAAIFLRLDRRDETVSAARNSFDKDRTVGRITQSVAELLDGGVQTLVEINIGSVGPKAGAQFFATDHLSWMVHEGGQNLKRLVLDPNGEALLEKPSLGEIQLEPSKPHAGTAFERRFHPHAPLQVRGSISLIGVREPAIFLQKCLQVSLAGRVAGSDKLQQNSG
jgi:hypothetical protein